MSGLAVEGGRVANLTINGFDGAGIFMTGPTDIYGNHIGCDPTASKVVPNDRGIVIDFPEGTRQFVVEQIEQNIISGNRRAGIFAWSATNPRIENNRIEWNGASGIFMGPKIISAFVFSNAVAYNCHAGVAVAAGRREVDVSYSNFLYANGGLAIDYMLDGVTRSVDGTSSKIDYPEITRAWYDPATDTTVIEGFQRAKRDGYTTRSINLYSNDAPDPSGFGEGQYPITDYRFADFDMKDDPTFRIVLKGKTRGRWVTGTVTVGWHYYWSRNPRGEGNNQGLLTTTSEFGPTVEIQGW